MVPYLEMIAHIWMMNPQNRLEIANPKTTKKFYLLFFLLNASPGNTLVEPDMNIFHAISSTGHTMTNGHISIGIMWTFGQRMCCSFNRVI